MKPVEQLNKETPQSNGDLSTTAGKTPDACHCQMNFCSTIRIATRESALARWQADWVAEQLKERGVNTEMVYVTTQGDVNQSGPVETIGTQGVFTKEVQRAVLDGRADLAVHSLKDLPTEEAPGLILAAVPQRAPIDDCLVSAKYESLDQIPPDAVIGTGSLRRKAQLLAINPRWDIRPIRGNLQTRLAKLDRGDYEALILAHAGLIRLGYEKRITQILPTDVITPAVSQGALGLECREEDTQTQATLLQLTDPLAFLSTVAERSLLKTLQGGCLAPVGAVTRRNGQELILTGRVAAVDGSRILNQTLFVRFSGTGPLDTIEGLGERQKEQARQLGVDVANQLLAQGAGTLINQARK